MQKSIKIKTSDQKYKIYGTLDYKKKTNNLIVFVHGFSGHQNEHQYFNAVDYFNNKGIATFRFDLYSWTDDSRRLAECDVKDHVDDLNSVIGYFKNKFKNIYLVGHSLGGAVILNSNISNITGIVLWDPTINLHSEGGFIKYDKKLKTYVVDWGAKFIVGKKMYKDLKKIKDYSDVAVNIRVPIKVICASKEKREKEWSDALKNFSSKNKLKVIKGANHNFDEAGTEKKLFDETYKWLK